MSLEFDTKEKITLSKRECYISKLMRFATMYDNHDCTVILKKSGLSEYTEYYQKKLTPYIYNGTWKNPNPRYAPEEVFDEIFNEFSPNDTEHRYLFLKALVEQINFETCLQIDFDLMQRYLSLLGFQIIHQNNTETKGYSLKQIGILEEDIEEEKPTTIFEDIISKFEVADHCYTEAKSSLANGNYKSVVSNCRIILEAVLKAYPDTKGRLGLILFKLSKCEETGEVKDLNQAIKYWADKHNNCPRQILVFIRFFSLYNCLCSFGSHSDFIPDYQTALWLLNETKTTIYYIYNS